jgi:hypothetical protein
VASTRKMNSTFTPIRRADSRTRQFWPLHLKSKIWSFETQPESATRIESRGLLTWICPLGTHGLVYRARPVKEVENYKDSKMTWSRRRKTLIRIRLELL